MMTKEEAIEQMIKEYKRGNEDVYTDFCKGYSCCDNCPLNSEHNGCVNDMVKMLIKRLIKAEEPQKAETNFEHYFKNANVAIGDGFLNILFDDEAVEAFGNGKATYDVRDWLLSPYKEPKPKYKLSKFEHDLLKCYHVSIYGIKDFWILEQMQDKGYFKGIPADVQIKDIFDNCEVVEE